ncbi:MAG: HEAT repeat domain-containing protein [Leptospirillia bacterium]
MEYARILIVVAITVLVVATTLFLLALAVLRLRQVIHSRRQGRVEVQQAPLVARICAGFPPTPEELPDILPTPGSSEAEALENVLREALAGAGPEQAARLEEFMRDAGITGRYLDMLTGGSRWERAMAAAWLADHRGPEIAEALLAATEDPDREVRTVAVRSLGRLVDDRSLVTLAEVLVAVAGGEENLSQRVVAGSLTRFGPQAADALQPMLEHPSWRVRSAAAYVLGEAGASSSVPKLTERLADAEPDVRAKAVQALGQVGARSALFSIIGSLEDDAWVVRMHAVRALGLLADPAAVAPLGRRLFDSHWRVRQEAAHILANMSAEAREVLISTLLTSDDHYARQQVVEEFQRTRVISDAIDGLEREVEGVVRPGSAAALLAAVANTGAVAMLAHAAISHGRSKVRQRVLGILAPLAHPRVTGVLERAATEDPDPVVRATAAAHLTAREAAAASAAEEV